MFFNIAVCDDDKLFLTSMTDLINQWISTQKKDGVYVQTYTSGEDLLYAMNTGESFNILFLDIDFPNEMKGLEVAKKIFQNDPYTAIVFVTNYDEYACAGYEVNALRYLRKPVDFNQISECLEIIWKKVEMLSGHSILLHEGTSVINLPLKSLVSIETFGHLLTISTVEGNKHRIRMKLSSFLASTSSETIIQCHRSYAVNLLYVRKFTPCEITLMNNIVIPLGRTFESDFSTAFAVYHQGKR